MNGFWSQEQVALMDSARAFVRAEVVPHLQEWEDAGSVPRELHVAAAKLGFLGLGVPETLGGAGGTFLDALAVTEAFTDAGASSGLLAALFTSGIALPHIVASGNADLVDRFVRPTLAGETIGSLAVTEPGGGSDVAGIADDRRTRDGDEYVVNGTKTFITSGVRADFVTTAVRTGGPGYARDQPARRREGHARLHGRPVAVEDGLALLRHRRARVRRRARAGREPRRRGEHRLRADRPGLRDRAAGARRARLRHRGPFARR